MKFYFTITRAFIELGIEIIFFDELNNLDKLIIYAFGYQFDEGFYLDNYQEGIK